MDNTQTWGPLDTQDTARRQRGKLTMLATRAQLRRKAISSSLNGLHFVDFIWQKYFLKDDINTHNRHNTTKNHCYIDKLIV